MFWMNENKLIAIIVKVSFIKYSLAISQKH